MVDGPYSIYQEKIQSGLYRKDAVQDQAVLYLQSLFKTVMDAHHAAPKNWFQKITGLGQTPQAEKRGIYLYGGVGRGKSMLMDLFFAQLPDDIKKRRVHFHSFMIEVHDYIHSRREATAAGAGVDGVLPLLAERIAEQSRILCFDEFHVTDIADAMILGRLFTALFDRDVVVVITSNWEPDRLYEGGLQRDRFLPFIELLKKQMQVFHLDGPTDYRLQALREEGVYFYPLNQDSQFKINHLFHELCAGGDVTGDIVLEVKGRQISVPTSCGSIARFSFTDICEKPYGAEDYLAIAERFRTVFLENIPRMGYDRRNEVKRLMILVDVLYENHRRLIISAERPPERLYHGQDHAIEFERTISRLIEMQGEKYLSELSN